MASESPADRVANEVADHLLRIQAVSLSPRELYTWTSGIRSPVYCDNRKILSYPDVREEVIADWAQLILTRCPDVQVLAGVATAGIPHAALLADKLRLPMVYVRSEAKQHGLGRAVEGNLTSGARTLVVEDLISTAGSIVGAAKQLRAVGAQLLGATAIMTYGLPQAQEALAGEGLSWFTLTDLGHLKGRARASGSLSDEELGMVDRGMASVVEQLRAKAASTAPAVAGHA